MKRFGRTGDQRDDLLVPQRDALFMALSSHISSFGSMTHCPVGHILFQQFLLELSVKGTRSPRKLGGNEKELFMHT